MRVKEFSTQYGFIDDVVNQWLDEKKGTIEIHDIKYNASKGESCVLVIYEEVSYI